MLSRDVARAFDDGAEAFFLVLQLPDDFAPTSGRPPFIGLDAGQTNGILGRSYLSTDAGGSFSQDPAFNYMFRLIASAEDDDSDSDSDSGSDSDGDSD